MNKLHPSNSGFTLPELLIAVAIIAILLTILLTNLIQARKSAHDSQALILARNGATLSEIHRSQNRDEALYPTPTPCVPLLIASLPSSIESCDFKQDASGSHTLVKSRTGNYYSFNGAELSGPLTVPPPGW